MNNLTLESTILISIIVIKVMCYSLIIINKIKIDNFLVFFTITEYLNQKIRKAEVLVFLSFCIEIIIFPSYIILTIKEFL